MTSRRKLIVPNSSPLDGDSPRREVAGCPTGLDDAQQAQEPQQPGGGGAPTTGEEEEKVAQAQRGNEGQDRSAAP